MTRRAAIGLVVGGALLTASESHGVDSVVADRLASIGTAADANALLGIERLRDPETPVTVSNHGENSMEVTVDGDTAGLELDVGDDGNGSTPPVTFGMAVGDSTDVDVLADGTVTLDIVASLRQNGTEVGRVELTRDAEARSQAGQIDVTSNVTVRVTAESTSSNWRTRAISTSPSTGSGSERPRTRTRTA